MNQQHLSSLVHRSQKILLVTGDRFTGDGVCALLALQVLLEKLKKEVVAIKPSPIPPVFNFLQGIQQIKTTLEGKGEIVISLPKGKDSVDSVEYVISDNVTDILISPKDGKKIALDQVSVKNAISTFDLIITLNTSRLELLDDVFRQNTNLFTSTPIVNISASTSNEFYGKINSVDLTKSSTCEIIYDWFSGEEEFLKHLDAEISTILLTGIISKTESFLEHQTTSDALSIAGQLQKLGARHSDIIEHLFKMKSLPVLKLWGVVLENLEFDPHHRISWVCVSEKDFRMTGASSSDLFELAHYLLRHLKGSDVCVVFQEMSSDKISLEILFGAGVGTPQEPIKYFFEDAEETLHGIRGSLSHISLEKAESKVLKDIMKLQKQYIPNLPLDMGLTKLELKTNESSDVPSLFGEKVSLPPLSTPQPPNEVPFQVFKK